MKASTIAVLIILPAIFLWKRIRLYSQQLGRQSSAQETNIQGQYFQLQCSSKLAGGGEREDSNG